MKILGLIQTGGTIATVSGNDGLELSTENVILDMLGDTAKEYEIKSTQPYKILSENAHPRHWQKLAQATYELANSGVDGIVITHGTDTMVYSASALSFMLPEMKIPIMLTGAMSSSDVDESIADGASNLLWSVRAAVHEDAPNEVCISFAGGSNEIHHYYSGTEHAWPSLQHGDTLNHVIIRGNRARKVAAWKPYYETLPNKRYAAFQSFHTPLLGAVVGKSALNENSIYHTENKRLMFNSAAHQSSYRRSEDLKLYLNERCTIVKVFPGLDASILESLAHKGYEGIILEAYPDGTMPSSVDYSLHLGIEKISRQGVFVGVTANVLGQVTMGIYQGGNTLRNAGAYPLSDISTETALVKLMWSLGNFDKSDVSSIMSSNIAGEFNPLS